jgi:hypothetical protein
LDQPENDPRPFTISHSLMRPHNLGLIVIRILISDRKWKRAHRLAMSCAAFDHLGGHRSGKLAVNSRRKGRQQPEDPPQQRPQGRGGHRRQASAILVSLPCNGTLVTTRIVTQPSGSGDEKPSVVYCPGVACFFSTSWRRRWAA